MRNLIEISDFTTDDLTDILDRADQFQRCWHHHTTPQTLQKQRTALWFWGKGFRNRVALEIDARAVGADAENRGRRMPTFSISINA